MMEGLLAALDARPGAMDTLVVVRDHAEVFAWGRRDGELDRPHDLRSVTKSITALLVGRAVDDGLLTWDTPLGAALPALPPSTAALAVTDLLTMRSGLACDDRDRRSPGHEDRMYRQRDWLAHWAALPTVEPPGTAGRYCTGNLVALGPTLEAVTGDSVPVFAERVLFGPLGVDATWATWDGHADTGGHLRLSARDLARVGALVADHGAWDGQPLLRPDTLDHLLRPVTTVDGRAYAHGWWAVGVANPGGGTLPAHVAQGNGGQLLVVVPDLALAIAATGHAYNRPDDALAWAQTAINALLR
jgi:CubicO group peptidase (beta-lactamase class C family)